MATRNRLVILFGGRSAEHEVSCVSARHVAAAADPNRFEVVAVGITRAGHWRLAELPDPLPDRLNPDGPGVAPAEIFAEPGTVVFPLVHGPMGEDGTLQGLLEVADIPYVGAGVLASALCMDKSMAKQVCAFHGLPQCRYRTASTRDDLAVVAEEAVAHLGLPLFVKPSGMGSSVGINRASTEQEALEALEEAGRYDETLLIEESIAGQEIEVAVLGDHDPEASTPGEIVPGNDFYDYADKYISNEAELLVPARIPDEVAQQAQQLALAAYRALLCEGMARVDFFYEAGGRGLLVSEVNTIPGFTPISMYPRLWLASGLAYPLLVERLVELAVERHERRRRHRCTDH